MNNLTALNPLRSRNIMEMNKKEVSLGTNKIPMKLLNELLITMQKGSLCALCGAIPTPIQNILKYFTHEFKADINQEA